MCCLRPPVLRCDFQSLATRPRGRPPPPPPGGPAVACARVSIASEALDYGGGGERGEQGRCIVFGPPGATSPAARLPTARRRQTSRQTLTHSSSPAPPAVSRQPPRRASLAPPRPSQRLSASPPGSPACASPALPPRFNPHLPSRLALGPKDSPPPALPPSPPAADRRRRGAMRRRRRRGTSARS
jgi:hypothetical protein